MGCICKTNNFCIVPLKESNKNITIDKNNYYQNLDSKIIYNGPNEMKKKIFEYSMNNNNSLDRNINESPKTLDNKSLKESNKDSKISKSFNIELYPMNDTSFIDINNTIKKNYSFKTNLLVRIPNKSTPKNSIHGKKIITSILKLRNVAFESKLNAFDSLNSINQNIIFSILPDFNEQMFEIWIEKNEQIFFQFKENLKWGIKQKGLVEYNGYKNVIFNNNNLCCLLIRVGYEKKYNVIYDKTPYFSKFEGPLFLKMNISKNEVIENNYILDGELECEIFNVKKFSKCQILKKLDFPCSDIDINCFEILNLINIFKRTPNKFIKLFYPNENFDIQNLKGSNNLINNEVLKKISDEENILNKYENNKEYYNNLVKKIKSYSNGVQINGLKLIYFQISIDTNESIIIIKKLIEENKYYFIFDNEFKYIGISIKEFKKEYNFDNIKCYFLLSNLLI